MKPERELRYFEYEPPVYSVPDRLHLTLDFASEPEMAEGLAAIGLEHLATKRLYSEMVRFEGGELLADVYGPLVTFTIGPEDRYAHMDASCWDLAERIEARIERASLSTYVLTSRRAEDDVHAPASRSEHKHAQAPLVPQYVVAVRDGALHPLAKVAGNWHLSAPLVVVDETTWSTGTPLPDGELGITNVSTGRLPDGTFGMIPTHVQHLPIQEAWLKAAEVCFAELVRCGGEIELDVSTFVRNETIRVASEPSRSFDLALDVLTSTTLHVRRKRGWGSLSSIVRSMLVTMCDANVPCLGRAHRLVPDAIERIGAGATYENTVSELFELTCRWLDAGCEFAGDPRRCVPYKLRTTEDDFVALAIPGRT